MNIPSWRSTSLIASEPSSERYRRARGEKRRVFFYDTEERIKESVEPYAASRAIGERLVYLDGPRTTGCSSSERAFPTLLREWLLTSS